ncbi:hypothetical protein GZA08_04630 [Pseudoroseicyclus sp. CLL3-39]|uniref:GntR family transcriptional regulator n=2 Tax=Pseudoroseicyclus tamaricis TaxID=2705421 RepID=A0A6B2JVM8_9RHOB|nr:hypothetical protein [Pseudoroseicyclus tamaricis]
MLLRRWKANGLKVGDRIESQNEIIKFCQFSLITVVKTLKDLEAEGVIRRQVGKGSFLVRAPWAEAFYRIGFFYNRDVVGGGIFDNVFYTRMVMAFEKQVVSDGHAFIMGSFRHGNMPVEVFEALDVVVLTSVTDETGLDVIDRVASQVCLIDHVVDHPRVHSYRIDFAPAFRAMVAHHGGRPARYLYIDSELPTQELAARRRWAEDAVADAPEGSSLRMLKIDPESRSAANAEALRAELEAHPADVIFGHANAEWEQSLEELAPGAALYPMSLDPAQRGFTVDAAGWMADVLPRIYANFEDRQAEGQIHAHTATFHP